MVVARRLAYDSHRQRYGRIHAAYDNESTRDERAARRLSSAAGITASPPYTVFGGVLATKRLLVSWSLP